MFASLCSADKSRLSGKLPVTCFWGQHSYNYLEGEEVSSSTGHCRMCGKVAECGRACCEVAMIAPPNELIDKEKPYKGTPLPTQIA